MQRRCSSEERIVRNVTANMKAEGFSVSAETKRECKAIAEGKRSPQQLVKGHLRAYQDK
jgi:hypothetical protein